jgi:hypothetical protein
MLFDFLLTVAFQHEQLLFFNLISASHQQNRAEFSLFQLLQHYQLVQTINQLIPSLYLLVKLLSLLLFVLLNHRVQKTTYNFLHNVDLNFCNDSIRLHNNVILISCFCFVF